MKVKIGDKVFDGEKIPVMVILSDQDKKNINNMHPDCSKYATFPDGWGSTQEMFAWMNHQELEQ